MDGHTDDCLDAATRCVYKAANALSYVGIGLRTESGRGSITYVERSLDPLA